MASKWENFLKNLGEWQGSFTSISTEGELLDSTSSILNLEGLENNQLVRFRLRRFGSGGDNQPPLSDYVQEYRSLGKEIIFFETGAFSKGSLQLAPFTEFGAEYGFVAENRRLRFVQLYDSQGSLIRLTLIREFRSGTDARERPQLTLEQLLGRWEGTACTAYSDLRPLETYATSLEVKDIGGDRLQQQLSFGVSTITTTARIERSDRLNPPCPPVNQDPSIPTSKPPTLSEGTSSRKVAASPNTRVDKEEQVGCRGNILHFEEGPSPRRILLLPDGTSSNTPLHLKLRQPFFVEVGWLAADNERQRLIRSYNDKGEWSSATHVIERRVEAIA